MNDPADLRREVAVLCYGMKGGITYGDVMEMDPPERQGYLEWLDNQLGREAAEIKKAQRQRGRRKRLK